MRTTIAAGAAMLAMAGPVAADPALLDGLSGLDPLSLGLGAALALPGLGAAAWMRWRLAQAQRSAAAAAGAAERFRLGLEAAPDGFFAWIGDSVICSRRLAVLLALGNGTRSDFAEVLQAFEPGDAALLDRAATRLRADGDGFSLDLSLRDGLRRVRAIGIRAEGGEDSGRGGELVWVQDVTEAAAALDDLGSRFALAEATRQRLVGLLDAQPMPVWVRDDDLSLVSVNRAYARAVEAASDVEVVAEQVELASDEVMRQTRALAARARAAGEPRAETFHLVLAGQRRLVEITEAPFTADDQLLTVGVCVDLTRIEELEAELERHISAQAEVLERLATAIAIYAPDTRLAFFNTAFTRLWRLDSTWLAGQPTHGAVLDALRERRLLPEVADYRAFKEGELKRFISLIDATETLLHLPDGRTLRQTIAAHPHGGLIFTFEDVTDTLALERSFNTMLAVQRETLDHLHEGVAVFRADGRLGLSNPAFARIWGLAPEWLGGEPHLTEVIGALGALFEGRPDRASDWPVLRERLLALFRDRVPRGGRLERQDDTVVDYASVPLPDGAMLLTWLDVTDSVRVERALRERNEALAAADLLKSEFIASVSAEIRKPLTTVIGFSEMLAAEFVGPLTPRQLDYARGILEASHGLEGLIADILDLAAIEAGQMTLELDTVDIHPLLTAVLGLARERLREKKLSLSFDCPLDIGWLVADERRLKQVLFTLIGTAIKRAPAGGRVRVRAERRRGEIAFIIADGAFGAPPETGPGPALVERFVERHGGRIEVETRREMGSIVTVRLPAGTASG
ncbi:PAS-domain containing protein [Phaeospirillum tilakii]|uniref:histidine kinase n=1 Tax=Phaeospirillum tilakii TaxID=741673 RepID=A0ABW5CDB7_9PROT